MHQIGNTFTRLLPAIEFTELAFTPIPDTVSLLGDPPANFDVVHSRSLLNTWYNKLQNALKEPVVLERRPGHRRVQVLGSAVFDFATDNTLQVYIWDFDENDRVMLTRLPSHVVVVNGVPHQALWMDCFKLGAFRALAQRHPGQLALCQDYVDWAHDRLVRNCWGQETQNHVRPQIAVALNVDQCLHAYTSQVPAFLPRAQPLRVDVYNQAVRFDLDCQKLKSEAPQLLPLFILLADVLTSSDYCNVQEPTARMKDLLLSQGLRPATWRLLCQVGMRWMAEFLCYFDLERQSQATSAMELLLLMQAFGTQQLAPPWLLQAFIQIGGNPNEPGKKFVPLLADMFAMCARLGYLAEHADDETLALLREWAHHIFKWTSKFVDRVPAGYLRRATLRGLIRKVQAQQKFDAMALTGSEPWPISYQINLSQHGGQAVILDSPLAVWTEGLEMRHCADKYIARCARGEWLMVSLRKADLRRPLATVAFDIQAPTVSQVRIGGFANHLVSPEGRELAQECLRQLQMQRNRSQPKPARRATSLAKKANAVRAVNKA